MNSPLNGTLKGRYLDCFGARSSNEDSLREIVKALVEGGVSRKTLILWAMETGCTKGSATNLVSQILGSLGLRERRSGAGPKPSREVLELLAYSREKYGDRYLKVLRAAFRTGYAHHKAKILSVAVLPEIGSYHGPMIRNGEPRHVAA